MKRLTLAFIIAFVALSTSSFAQIGVGIGSHGLNIKTNPDAKTGLIVRTGFGIHSNPLTTFIRPEAAFVKRHHYSEKTKLYAGVGVASEMRLGISELAMGYGIMVPIGLELFPTESRKLSVSLETGISFLSASYADTKFGNYGLIEISFYLNDRGLPY